MNWYKFAQESTSPYIHPYNWFQQSLKNKEEHNFYKLYWLNFSSNISGKNEQIILKKIDKNNSDLIYLKFFYIWNNLKDLFNDYVDSGILLKTISNVFLKVGLASPKVVNTTNNKEATIDGHFLKDLNGNILEFDIRLITYNLLTIEEKNKEISRILEHEKKSIEFMERTKIEKEQKKNEEEIRNRLESGLKPLDNPTTYQKNHILPGLYIEEKKPLSNHELIIMDIFGIINISYQKEITYPLWQNSKCFKGNPRIDFSLNGGYLEIFGGNSPEYLCKQQEKIKNIENLNWINAKDLGKVSAVCNRTLLQYCKIFDKYLKTNFGSLLITDCEKKIKSKCNLLSEYGLELSSSYIVWLNSLGKNLDKRKEIQDKLKITSSYNRFSQIGIEQKKPSLEEINSWCSQNFVSSHLWTEEERVALFFNNVNNISKYLNNANYNLKAASKH